MDNDNKHSLLDGLARFEGYLKEYTDAKYISVVDFDPYVVKILNMDHLTLTALTAEELLAYSATLSRYAIYLQTELNENQAKFDWCKQSISYLMAKNWSLVKDTYADKDIKEMMVLKVVDGGVAIAKMKIHLGGRVTLLTDKIRDVRSMEHTLCTLAKRKTF
jgi:hypothetical protein